MNALHAAIREGRFVELTTADKQESLSILASSITLGLTSDPADVITRKMLERETQACTYLGNGIACPHARSATEGELVCAVGWSRAGVRWSEDGGAVAAIVLMYYIPSNCNNAYLNEIASVARMFQNAGASAFDGVNSLGDVRDRFEHLMKSATVTTPAAVQTSAPRDIGYKSLSNVLKPDLLEMIRSGQLNDVKEFIRTQPAPEIAELIASLDAKDGIVLFRLLPRACAGETFSLLEPDAQNALLSGMAREETRQVISALSPDDRTALFEELPARVTQELLNMLDDAQRKEALTLLSYPEGSVGRLMTNRYVAVREHWTVAETLEHIRNTGTDSETIAMVYVIDDKGVLIDDIRLRKIILSPPTARIADLMDRSFASLSSLQGREEAVRVFRKYDLYALPVVDADGVLLGIITHDDILDVAQEEATEDFHKGSAIQPLGAHYLKAPLRLLYNRRIAWLLILVVINIFSGAGIAHFEGIIQSVVALVFFLPLLIDSGGNAGSQAATLVIRSMALGELKLGDYLKAAGRELLVSAALGTTMAAAVFLLGWWRSGIPVGITVALAMACIVMLGSLVGLSLPFMLRKMRMDPATASGPLVTSIADIFGVIIYFSIATALLSHTAR